MSAADLLLELEAAGVVMWVEGDRLRCQPKADPLSDDQRDRIRTHRDELAALLAAAPVEVTRPALEAIATGPECRQGDGEASAEMERDAKNRRESDEEKPAFLVQQIGSEVAADLPALLAELHDLRDRWRKVEAFYHSGQADRVSEATRAEANRRMLELMDRMFEVYRLVDQLAPGSLEDLWNDEDQAGGLVKT